MTSFNFIEISSEPPKWFKDNSEHAIVNIIDTWTDKGLFRNYNGKYDWLKVTESEGLITYELIEPQLPSIVLNIEKYTRTYCETNKFFTYYYDTYEDGTIVYCITSESIGRLSKYKNKIITIIDIDKPHTIIQIN